MREAYKIVRDTIVAMTGDEFLTTAKRFPSRAAMARSFGLGRTDIRMINRKISGLGLEADEIWPAARDRRRESIARFDLMNETHAYFYGLALADGSIRGRNGDARLSGAVSIEIKQADREVLDILRERLPWQFRITDRTRPSPFNLVHGTFSALVCHAFDLRGQMMDAGFPVGKKSRICAPPKSDYDAKAFWRGFLDGDGSIGFTATGIPFVSLVTVSESIFTSYCNFIESVLGWRPAPSRNTRDNAWNITLYRGKAVRFAEFLYSGAVISMRRKAEAAAAIMAGDWEKNAPWRRK
ncbi:hypothetical protein [Rhizobium azibense]|uniref:LAGLIDADG DNA endonuclease family protein n=1 Tax=Rhizobium azibense TaxID=1136135 RepID=A0A4R3RHJ4_9HYPH|nr:hypothetical protein [Rhizobium azibense]TCU34134.1 hypothetical protein EV129_113118 [Rhizobium azibense]